MAKHVCGSCRFFEAAREGKQGWCTHPERQESSAVRMLVRAAELRCRDDWGHDKWAPQTGSDEVLDIVMNDDSAHRTAATDRRYIPPVERTSPELSEPAALTATPLVPVIDFEEPNESPEPARPVSEIRDRELVRRAQAQFLARQKNKGYSVAPKRDDEPEALVISNQFIPPSRETKYLPSDRQTNSVFEFGGRSNDDAFDAIPDIDATREAGPSHRPDRDQGQRAGLVTGRTRHEPIRDLESRRSDEPAGESAESPVFEDPPGADQWFDPIESADHGGTFVETINERFEDPERDWVGAHHPEEDDWEVARQSAKPAEATNLWADIPKCCLTCRDFRPAGNGERGWCTNQWAFKHRRMVDAHDRPCETSIGHWWIPGDAAWQGEFDISALGQPTPLMDKWFGRLVADEGADVPVERRRRKTGSW